LPSFGEKLKQERVKRKITLEQVSGATKIGTRMLQALEEDKFNQLPGGIFNKGFVRAYSRFVGLDEDQTVADYLQASGDAPPVSNDPASRDASRGEAGRDEARENNKNRNNKNDEESIDRIDAGGESLLRQLPWGLFAAVLLIVALALFYWSHHRREQKKQSLTSTPATIRDTAPDNTTPQIRGPVTQLSTASSVPLPTIASAPSSVPKTPVPKIPAAKTSTSNDATVAASPIPGEFKVVVQAREDSWVSIIADGSRVPSEVLTAGSERTVHARREVVVKVGNAGAVDFQFNGVKLPAKGDFGEVKTVTFGTRGMLANAPASASSP
jgi:cytoskeleton protein RodZ